MLVALETEDPNSHRSAIISRIGFRWIETRLQQFMREVPPEMLPEPCRSDVQQYLTYRFRIPGTASKVRAPGPTMK
jgi:hypothetical protein